MAIDVQPDATAARCASDLVLDLTAPIPDLEIAAKLDIGSMAVQFTKAEPPVDAQGCIRDLEISSDWRSSPGHVGYAASDHRPFTLLLFKQQTRDPLASPRPVPASVPLSGRDVTRWFTFLLPEDLASGEIRGRLFASAPRALFVFPRTGAGNTAPDGRRSMAGPSGQEPIPNEPLLIDGTMAFALDGLTFYLGEQRGSRDALLADTPAGPIALPSLGRRTSNRVRVNEAAGSNARDFVAPVDLIRAYDEAARQSWMCHTHSGMDHASRGVSLTPRDVASTCSPFDQEMAQLAVKIETADRKARKPLLADLTARVRELFPDATGP